MRKSSGLLALVALLASVVGGNWIYAQQRKAGHVLLSAEDYMEIQQLYGSTRATSIRAPSGTPRGCSLRTPSRKWARGDTRGRS